MNNNNNNNNNNNITDEDAWTLVETNTNAAPVPTLTIEVSVVEADTASASSQELNSAAARVDSVTENSPEILDESCLFQLFPTKDESKRQIWLSTLHQNEFETLRDLDSLDNEGWNSLSLPLAVKAVLKAEAKKRSSEIKASTDRCDLGQYAELLYNKVDRNKNNS